jgi:hypothetical protein
VSAALVLQQQALLHALLGADAPPPGLQALPAVSTARGLAAYQGHLRSLSARSLGQVFTQLVAHLGEADFAALAWSFWRAEPPASGDLAQWGSGLEAFLMDRAGAASGLPGLARLDWALHRAERAANAVLDVDSLQCLATEAPDTLQLALRPGLQLLHMEAEALSLLGMDGMGPRHVLVWRQAWRAEWATVSALQASFFGAVLAGHSLQSALEAAAARPDSPPDETFDFADWLQSALQQEWLCGASRRTASDRPRDESATLP